MPITRPRSVSPTLCCRRLAPLTPLLLLLLLLALLALWPAGAMAADGGEGVLEEADTGVEEAVALAQQGAQARSAPLRVGVRAAPPLAFRGERGGWDGIAVALWEEVARESALAERGWELVEIEGGQRETLRVVEAGEVDLALMADATAEAAATAELGPIYMNSPLGTARSRGQSMWQMVKRLLSTRFLKVAVWLAVILLVVGVLIWLFERRHNEEQFAEGAGGIWSGFWWACVTMTTIGYGDKAPCTVPGRVLAMLWMLMAMAVTASLTAAVTSVVALPGMSQSVQIPRDLRQMKVGVIEGSRAEEYLGTERVQHRGFEKTSQALRALEEGEVEILVHDLAALRYLKATSWKDSNITITPSHAAVHRVSFVMPQGAEHAEDIERAVLQRINSPRWQQVLERYMASGGTGG